MDARYGLEDCALQIRVIVSVAVTVADISEGLELLRELLHVGQMYRALRLMTEAVCDWRSVYSLCSSSLASWRQFSLSQFWTGKLRSSPPEVIQVFHWGENIS